MGTTSAAAARCSPTRLLDLRAPAEDMPHVYCRVFPATGSSRVRARSAIAERAAEWEFDVRDERDRVETQAVRAAAATSTAVGRLPAGAVPLRRPAAVLAARPTPPSSAP